MRSGSPRMINSPEAASFKCELNKYYDPAPCGIGFHGDGERRRVIAVRLGVSKSHVEKYVRRLLDKTSSSNRTELVRRALQLGLLRLDAPAPPGQASRHAEALLPNREGGG